MKDVKEKVCGCVIFEVGPPILCESHQHKVDKKAAREKAREEKGLRKTVAEQATSNGHDLSQFREYASCAGKFTAHCRNCGGIVIVYDDIPAFGDQVAGAVFKTCKPSNLVGTLGAAEREAISIRLADARREGTDTDAEGGA